MWALLDELVAQCPVVVDRPRGTAHPRFPQFVYPLDYGYLEGTTSGDGVGIDVWCGRGGERVITGLYCTLDPFKKDAEIKLLLGVADEELQALSSFYADQPQGALHVPRPKPSLPSG